MEKLIQKRRRAKKGRLSIVGKITKSPVVAVLEIHIDKNDVQRIKPNRIAGGFGPSLRRTERAIRRWSPHFSIESATKKPPKKRRFASFL